MFHVTSSPPCWWTVNKRSLTSSFCLSTSIFSFHHCYLCFPRPQGVGRQHATFTSCQNAACFNEFTFSLTGRLCSGGKRFDWENLIFAAYFTLRGRYTYAHARKTLVPTELSASIDKDPYLCVNEKANGDYSSSVYNRVFSLTWPASTQIYWNKRKRLHKKKDAMERTLTRRG